MPNENIEEMSEIELLQQCGDRVAEIKNVMNGMKSAAAKVAGDPFTLGMMVAEVHNGVHEESTKTQDLLQELHKRAHARAKLAVAKN